MFPATYQEHVLNNPATCRNCLSLYRRPERDLKPATRSDTLRDDAEIVTADTADKADRELVVGTHYRANPEQTDPGRHPADDPGYRYSRKFCDCGAPNAYTRIWDDPDIDRERFGTLCRNLFRTLDWFGVSVDGPELVRHAFDRYKARVETTGPIPKHGVERALAAGLETAIVLKSHRGGASRADAD